MNYKIIIVYNEQTGQIQQALFREILAERESNIPIQLHPIDHPTKFSMVQVPDASFLTIPKKEFLFNDGFWHSFGFNVYFSRCRFTASVSVSPGRHPYSSLMLFVLT